MSNSIVYLTALIGSSSGGYPFKHYRGYDGAVVRSITVWGAASCIKSIKLTFTDGTTKQYGVVQGDVRSKSFTFNDGESITSLSLWGNGAGSRAGWIKFITSEDREFSHGMYSWGRKTEYPQSVASGIFIGVFGRANLDVDALGLIFLRPLSSCTVSSFYYPTLQFSGTSGTTLSKLKSKSKSITLQNIDDANQSLQVEMSDEVSFSDVLSEWYLSESTLSNIGLLHFWDANNIVVEPNIPVLTLSGNQVGWTSSALPTTFNTLTPKETTIVLPWSNTFLLNPQQTSTVSANVYSGVVDTVPFNATFNFKTTSDGSFFFYGGVTGSYYGQTYFNEPITS